MTRQNDDMWCILTTTDARTIPLVLSLVERGIEAWSPSEKRSLPRTRSRKARVVDGPIVPGFVFARSAHLMDLFLASASPVSPHPRFRIFRDAGRIPLIADEDIAELRLAEERLALKERRKRRKAYVIGSRVRTDEPAWVGMIGIVEGGNDKAAWINFGGRHRVKIASWLLRTDDVQNNNPSGTPAKAA